VSRSEGGGGGAAAPRNLAIRILVFIVLSFRTILMLPVWIVLALFSSQVCPHTAIYVCSHTTVYYCLCILIRLYTCPHATTCLRRLCSRSSRRSLPGLQQPQQLRPAPTARPASRKFRGRRRARRCLPSTRFVSPTLPEWPPVYRFYGLPVFYGGLRLPGFCG
jgi:hypothetical protein